MNTPKIFQRPIVQLNLSVPEEDIYGFKRRTVFSPKTAANGHVKLCTVTGDYGAQSQTHTHFGDEIVVTLEGENLNFSGNKEFELKQYQGIAIPPGAEHRTTVTGVGGWKGVSFYCEDCPLIQTLQHASDRKILRKKIDKFSSRSPSKLQKQLIFSPELKETHFLELFVLSSDGPAPDNSFVYQGETIYFTVSGSFFILWKDSQVLLKPGMAAVIPAEFSHVLKVEDAIGCKILGVSCSSCPLINSMQIEAPYR